MKIIFFFLISIFFLCSCSTQSVFVRSQKPIKTFTVDQGSAYKSDSKTVVVKVPNGLGDVKYEATDMMGKKITGVIKRDETRSILLTSSIIATAITLPVMSFVGALVVNPQWILSLATHSGSHWSYASQTASVYTLPSAFLFGMLGSLPMLGLLISEETSASNLRLNW